MKTKCIVIVSLFMGLLSAARANEGFPKFSWDHVPLYAHFGIGEGLQPEQYDFLAQKYNFIGLTAGRFSKSTEGSAEIYTAKAARAIKQRNPNAKILFYWSIDRPKHQSKLSNAAYPGEYIVHTQHRKNRKDQTIKYFDLVRKDVQDWWSDAADRAVHQYGCDGIFVDGATAGRADGPLSNILGKKKAAEMDAAVFAILKDTRQKIGPDKLLIFNPLHGLDEQNKQIGKEYLPVTDGAMIDNFDRGGDANPESKEYMANTIKLMQRTARDGKVVIFKGWPGFTMARRRNKELQKKMTHEELRRAAGKDIVFPLACFLIGAEKNCFFCYTWGWNPEEGTFEWYPEFDKPLGPPKGDAVQDGWTFRREFEHASVFVDLENRNAKINWL